MRKYSNNLAFTDLLFNLLIGFTSLLLIAFLLINPIAEEGKIDPRSEFIITSSWDDESAIDIDIWVKGPDDTIVGFPSKDGRYMVLERDDLGDTNDLIQLNGDTILIQRNLETLSINAIVPGEYIVTVHNYSTSVSNENEEYPTPVTIDIMDMNPFSLDMSRTVKVRLKEEVSVFSFMVDEDGNIYDMNDQIDVKIRPNKDGSRTFRGGNGVEIP
jgi:hypothetical protein